VIDQIHLLWYVQKLSALCGNEGTSTDKLLDNLPSSDVVAKLGSGELKAAYYRGTKSKLPTPTTYGLPPPVKLDCRHLPFTVLVRHKTQIKIHNPG
jgi:hypothetical protein